VSGQQSHVDAGVELIASLRVGLVVGWGWAFIKVELIVIVKVRVSSWGGIHDFQRHPNSSPEAAGLVLLSSDCCDEWF